MDKPIDIQKIGFEIKEFSYSLGFDACGFSKARFLEEENQSYQSWISQNHHAGMKYLERNIEKRLDPRLLHDGTKTIISLLANYFPEKQIEGGKSYKIAKYAYGKDYHIVLKEKMAQFILFLKEIFPDCNPRAFVDSAPVLERKWAQNSGLGWIGKNSLLLNKKLGSFFFIAEIMLDVDLIPDSPLTKSYCGTCTRCIDACPTSAIQQPYIVNAEKCISYQTIENKELPDKSFLKKSKEWIFGCDICQDVCPWNKNIISHKSPEFEPSDRFLNLKKEEWNQMTQEHFNQLFKDSPLQRSGYQRMVEIAGMMEE